MEYQHKVLRSPSELLSEINLCLSGNRLILAIDGGSGSGKSTLSTMLARYCNCAVFHMDDFFLRPEQRTPARFAEVGGNVDRERFLSEVLLPLHRNQTIKYRRFDCHTMTLCSPITVSPTDLTVIEGSYSMHPTLSPYYSMSVFLDCPPDLQKKRILHRNTREQAETFFSRWIPLENRYFDETDIRKRCDFILQVPFPEE